jgi:hypothetical protein
MSDISWSRPITDRDSGTLYYDGYHPNGVYSHSVDQGGNRVYPHRVVAQSSAQAQPPSQYQSHHSQDRNTAFSGSQQSTYHQYNSYNQPVSLGQGQSSSQYQTPSENAWYPETTTQQDSYRHNPPTYVGPPPQSQQSHQGIPYPPEASSHRRSNFTLTSHTQNVGPQDSDQSSYSGHSFQNTHRRPLDAPASGDWWSGELPVTQSRYPEVIRFNPDATPQVSLMGPVST